VRPPGSHPAQRGAAVPAEKTWGEGKDEDDRKVSRAAAKKTVRSAILTQAEKGKETRDPRIFGGISFI